MIEKNNLKLKFFIIPPIGFIIKNNEIDEKFNLNVNMYVTYTGYVRDSSKRCWSITPIIKIYLKEFI